MEPRVGQNPSAANDGEYQDCTSCRLMGVYSHVFFTSVSSNNFSGSATFLALGAYCMTVKEESPMGKLPANRIAASLIKQKPRIPGALGVMFIGLGIYRFVR